MSELRYNATADEWVIIASERAKRPEDFKHAASVVAPDNIEHCPFCAGHEQKTQGEIYAVREDNSEPNTPGWKVRIVPNQFPAVTTEKNQQIKNENIFNSKSGFGIHDVIIESPDHNLPLCEMDKKQVERVFLTYKQRFLQLSRDPRFETIILFKNHGQAAGTSLSHPHSQVVALPIIPSTVLQKVEVARRYFAKTGLCLYCQIVENEIRADERVVIQSENFLAYEPFGSHTPFETMILPKWHAPSFAEITDEQCRELAGVMQQIIKRINAVLNTPAYNFALYSIPLNEGNHKIYHWHFKIYPRVSQPAGFELGSGMYINTMVPEDAARYLREAKIT
jgi:UDPglucose--hexose-1-phosphate uridylyltransferase